jgi:hypothetical protein
MTTRDRVIGAYVTFAIAGGFIAEAVITNWNTRDKIAGMEMIVIFPAAVILWITGLWLAAGAYRARSRDFASFLALLLNGLPFVWITSVIIARAHTPAHYATLVTALLAIAAWSMRRSQVRALQ